MISTYAMLLASVSASAVAAGGGAPFDEVKVAAIKAAIFYRMTGVQAAAIKAAIFYRMTGVHVGAIKAVIFYRQI